MEKELGKVIKNPAVRQGLYLGYVAAAIVVGVLHAAFSVYEDTPPLWLSSAAAVVSYLAIPLGSLAAVNVNATNSRSE